MKLNRFQELDKKKRSILIIGISVVLLIAIVLVYRSYAIYQEKQEIMVTGEISKEDKRELCKWIQEKDGIVLVKTKENEKQLSEIAPFTKEYKVTEEPLFYFCSGQKCSPPEKKLRKILEKI